MNRLFLSSSSTNWKREESSLFFRLLHTILCLWTDLNSSKSKSFFISTLLLDKGTRFLAEYSYRITRWMTTHSAMRSRLTRSLFFRTKIPILSDPARLSSFLHESVWGESYKDFILIAKEWNGFHSVQRPFDETATLEFPGPESQRQDILDSSTELNLSGNETQTSRQSGDQKSGRIQV